MEDATLGRAMADELQDAGRHIHDLLESARRRIWLQTRCRLLAALPPLNLADAMSRVVRRTRYSDVRLLIDDDLALKKSQPRLTQTVSRLTTGIAVRCLAPVEDSPMNLLLVVDRSAWLYAIQHKARLALEVEHHDRPGTHAAAERFATDWAAASESLELRKLML